MNAPDDSDTLPKKVHAIISLALAGRGCEVHQLKVHQLTRLVADDHSARWEVKFRRGKNNGNVRWSTAWITGSLEVIENFLICVSLAGSLLCYFLKFKLNSTGRHYRPLYVPLPP